MKHATQFAGLIALLAFGVSLPLRAAESSPDSAVSTVPDTPTPPLEKGQQVRILILTGMEYPGHPWRLTAPFIRDILRKDPRLQATVQEDPNFLASAKLHDYDAIVLNYMNWQTPDPGPQARSNLQKAVDSGKGLFLVHFACGAFQDWPEFRKLAGRVYDPKLRGHDPRGPFRVNIISADHAITKGLESFDVDDELYTCLTGDAPVEILATARSKVDNKDYPIAFVLTYGKGRVFHTVLGHDVKALSPAGVGDLFRRAAAWTARLPPTTDN
jgi:type 1 glutamine amidotransferase